MRILFISRFKSGFDDNLSPIVKNQGDSLIRIGHQVEYYIVEEGFRGYLKLIFNLGRHLQLNSYDIIHAHYSLTSIIATMATLRRRIIVSLMGSDTQRKGLMLYLIRFFALTFWDTVIVKTDRMKRRFNIKNARVLPNGVDFERFDITSKEIAQNIVGFIPQKINILFLADSGRIEKNVILARKAIELLNNKNLVLHEIYPVLHEKVPFYLNAADVLVVPSIYEGSPNIVKEAMACCIPIVSTDVGDVKENMASTEGCFLAAHDPADFSEKIAKAISFGSRTNGRDNIRHLDSKVIAQQLIEIYNSTRKQE